MLSKFSFGKYKSCKAFLYVFIILLPNFALTQDLNKTHFKTPPAQYGPYVWWHWMNGNISKEGITKDLESFKEKGIRGATILNIGDIRNTVPKGDVLFMSKEWQELFAFSLDEADRLGLELGFHNCDGWSTSGGPWITPENSMKELVWSKQIVQGGQHVELNLKQPPSRLNFYKDIAVLAYQSGKEEHLIAKNRPLLTLSNQENTKQLHDGNPKTWAGVSADPDGNVFIQFDFGEKVVKEKIQLLFFIERTFPSKPYKVELHLSQNGNNFYKHHSFTIKNNNRLIDPVVETFESVKSRYYKFVFANVGQKTDNDAVASMFKVNPATIKLAEIELLNKQEIPHWNPGIKWLLAKLASVRHQRWMFSDVFGASADKSTLSPDKIIDITNHTNDHGELQWDFPDGHWTVLRMGYTTTGVTNHPSTDEGRGLECDKLSEEALDIHIENFAAIMLQQNNDHLGNALNYILIDSWEALFQNWTESFSEEFKQKRQYDIMSYLPVLAGETVTSQEDSEYFLYDFRKTISDLLMENYYGKFKEFCHQHSLEMRAEVIYGHSNHPPVDVLHSYGITDVPMTEFWSIDHQGNRQVNNRRVFTDNAASAAHIYGKDIVRAEAFTEGLRKGYWNRDLFDRKSSGDYNFCEGINQYVLHCSPHQPDTLVPGFALGDNGAHFQRKNTYWKHINPWINYLSRCQYMLRQGKFVADIAYFIGDDIPNNFIIGDDYQIPEGYRADKLNPYILSKLEVENGKIVLDNGPSYEMLIIPDNRKLSVSSIKTIASLLDNGGVVITSKKDAQKIRNYNSNTSGVNLYDISDEKSLEQIISLLEISKDFTYQASPENVIINFVHRKTSTEDIYFITNPVYDSVVVNASFRVNNKNIEIWDAETGEIYLPVQYQQSNERTDIPLTLSPASSVFVVFRNNKDQQQVQIDNVTRNNKQFVIDYKDVTSQPGKNEAFVNFRYNGHYVLDFSNNTSKTIIVDDIPKAMRITGPWKIQFDDNHIITTDTLFSWTKHHDYKYYAGSATYYNSFNLSDEQLENTDALTLDLGTVKSFARVYINGKEVVDMWKPPFSVDIQNLVTQGKNEIEIVVTNLWHNRLIGDLNVPKDQKSIWTTSPIERWFDKDAPLESSGLMGPVRIITGKKVPIDN